MFTPGILHIGTGRFVLGHLATYVQSILKDDPSWGLVMSSIRGAATIKSLLANSGCYTLVERDEQTMRISKLNPIVALVDAKANPKELCDWIANPLIRVITMTVTNKGYYMKDGILDLHNGDIQHDMECLKREDDTGCPFFRTVYGYLITGKSNLSCEQVRQRSRTRLGLKMRAAPLTIMSLDNNENNTRALKKGIQALLKELGWNQRLDENVHYVNTMVDRIVPAASAKDTAELKATQGIDTDVVVLAETYKQLVMESGQFSYANPDWQQHGVDIVQDVGKSWKRKGLIVNGGHHVVSVCGQRLGSEYVTDAMNMDSVVQLLDNCHFEMSQLIDDGTDAIIYAQEVRKRFRNPFTGDTIDRISASSTRKVAQRFLEPIIACHERSRHLTWLTFAVAVWFVNLLEPVENTHRAVSHHSDERFGSLVDMLPLMKTSAEKLPNRVLMEDILARIGKATHDVRFAVASRIRPFVWDLCLNVIHIKNLGLAEAMGKTKAVTHVLLDCDGTLVNSENLAFDACAQVINRLLTTHNRAERYTGAEIMGQFKGCNFAKIIKQLSTFLGFIVTGAETREAAEAELSEVTAVLNEHVRECEGVSDNLKKMADAGLRFAVVSSSAISRVRVCLAKANLASFVHADHVFSALTSMHEPECKPSPAIYLHALEKLGITTTQCVAVEDSVPGTRSGVLAGITVVGYVGTLPPLERQSARIELEKAGAIAVADHWDDVTRMIEGLRGTRR